MPGLIPVDGSGSSRPPLTCFYCGAPAFGPCAMCHVIICSASQCAVVVKEKGLADTVLCRACAKARPRWSTAVALGLSALGGGALVALQLAAPSNALSAIATVLAAIATLLGLAAAVVRWQWLARLRRARQLPRRRR